MSSTPPEPITLEVHDSTLGHNTDTTTEESDNGQAGS